MSSLSSTINSLSPQTYVDKLDLSSLHSKTDDIKKYVSTIDQKLESGSKAPESKLNENQKTVRQELFEHVTKNVTSAKKLEFLKELISPSSNTAITADRVRIALRVKDSHFENLGMRDLAGLTEKEFSKLKSLHGSELSTIVKAGSLELSRLVNPLKLAEDLGLGQMLSNYVEAKSEMLYQQRLVDNKKNKNEELPPRLNDKEKLALASEFLENLTNGDKISERTGNDIKKAFSRATKTEVSQFTQSYDKVRIQNYNINNSFGEGNAHLGVKSDLEKKNLSGNDSLSWTPEYQSRISEQVESHRSWQIGLTHIPGKSKPLQETVTSHVKSSYGSVIEKMKKLSFDPDNPETFVAKAEKLMGSIKNDPERFGKFVSKHVRPEKIDNSETIYDRDKASSKLTNAEKQESIDKKVIDLLRGAIKDAVSLDPSMILKPFLSVSHYERAINGHLKDLKNAESTNEKNKKDKYPPNYDYQKDLVTFLRNEDIPLGLRHSVTSFTPQNAIGVAYDFLKLMKAKHDEDPQNFPMDKEDLSTLELLNSVYAGIVKNEVPPEKVAAAGQSALRVFEKHHDNPVGTLNVSGLTSLQKDISLSKKVGDLDDNLKYAREKNRDNGPPYECDEAKKLFLQNQDVSLDFRFEVGSRGTEGIVYVANGFLTLLDSNHKRDPNNFPMSEQDQLDFQALQSVVSKIDGKSATVEEVAEAGKIALRVFEKFHNVPNATIDFSKDHKFVDN